MRIVITGGTGLIGRALTQRLVADRHDVTILSRSSTRPEDTQQGSFRIVAWDGRSAAGWAKWVDGCDAVINLAGENVAGDSLLNLRWTKERKKRILESRANAGKAVSQAVEAASIKPKAVLQVSAVGYYGKDTGERINTEETPGGEDFLAGVCRVWEASTSGLDSLGVRRIVLRLGVVLSARGGALPRQMLPYRFYAGGKMGSGKQWISWTHIMDVVEAIRFLLEHGECRGIYNLTAPQPERNETFSRCLGEALHRPAWLPVPGFVMRTLFGEAASILLEGQRVVPQRLVSDGYHFHFPALDGALKDLLQTHP